MKKIVAIILAVSMCFCLVACSTNDEVPMVGDNTTISTTTDAPLE